ncbi:Beta-amyrin synthase [Corchorus olitorius]|uniref:Beta-amyrin synthase n=1 Tax=Corchorus olitorius TaxID=93759 RepID=A0A1R3L0Z4_9ROSI|nr:Beta-amyrin synthase [Corchorus olitorius]
MALRRGIPELHGGVIRGSTGRWLIGFRSHLWVCSNIVAETASTNFSSD